MDCSFALLQSDEVWSLEGRVSRKSSSSKCRFEQRTTQHNVTFHRQIYQVGSFFVRLLTTSGMTIDHPKQLAQPVCLVCLQHPHRRRVCGCVYVGVGVGVRVDPTHKCLSSSELLALNGPYNLRDVSCRRFLHPRPAGKLAPDAAHPYGRKHSSKCTIAGGRERARGRSCGRSCAARRGPSWPTTGRPRATAGACAHSTRRSVSSRLQTVASASR